MYIPKHFEEKDKIKLLEFMRQYNFAVLVSEKENLLAATHLPFIMEEKGGDILLRSHMAKANPQWRSFTDGKEVLIIFSEPHSYISPSLYDHRRNVPTWNYIAVHAYGEPQIFNDGRETEMLLESMFEEFEKSYKTQFVELDSDYKNKLLKGIVAFEIKVTRLEGKFKLSQNKTSGERERIIDSLKSQPDKVKSDLAKFMKK
jgi:transcriptional regulator